MVITRERALEVARKHVQNIALSCNEELEILPGETRETEKGWVFFYNTVDFIRSGDPSDALAGNNPFAVLRNGEVYELPVGVSLEQFLLRLSGFCSGFDGV